MSIQTTQEYFGADITTAPIPITAVAGRLMLVVISSYNTGGVPLNLPAGWDVLLTSTATELRPLIVAKKSDGTEGSTLSITSNVLTNIAAVSYSASFSGNISTGVKISALASAVATGGVSSIDPLAVAADWGSDPGNMFLAIGMAGRTVGAFSTKPAGYAYTNVSSGADSNNWGTDLSVGHKTADSASDDPTAFALASWKEFLAVTIAIRPFVNIAPSLDTPNNDVSIGTDATASINIAPGFSDANGDTLTFTVAPALPSGLTLTSAGSIDITGPLSITPAANYTITAHDNNGGTVDDVISLEITAPALTVGVISNSSPRAGETFTVAITNSAGAVTALTSSGALVIDSQTATELTIAAPHPMTHGDKSLKFGEVTTITVTDGVTVRTFDIQIQAEAGYEFGVIVTPDPLGIYKESGPGVADPSWSATLSGLSVYGRLLTGDATVALTTGLVSLEVDSTYSFALSDGEWSPFATATLNAPSNQAPVITAPTDRTFEFVSGGAGLAHNDAVLVAHLATATVIDDADTLTLNDALSGLPNPLTANTYTLIYTATDTDGETGSDSMLLTVAEAAVANNPPTFTNSPSTIATVGSLYSFTPTTNDADGDTVTLTTTTLPSWLTFAGGSVTGTPAEGDIGANPVVLSGSDGVDSTLLSFSVVVGNVDFDYPEDQLFKFASKVAPPLVAGVIFRKRGVFWANDPSEIYNVASAISIKAAVVSANHSEKFCDTVTQLPTTPGSDWANGLIVIVLPEDVTEQVERYVDEKLTAKIALKVEMALGESYMWYAPIQLMPGHVD